ncbi:hypothetical protein ACWE42_17855 [Sutcliffiella cohnii]|uniref:hypothetical protein n=1 Tax=Sutcliffiella cohnii TaxID=33932 RepID=UPI002E24F248|nr:hypothetical protein [Sutcliffiella cohnii]
MDIQSVVNLFYLYLFVVIVISFLIGYVSMKKSKSHKMGFLIIVSLSFVLLMLLLQWFQSTSAALFIGTIPWLFNQAIAILVYLIYVIITWFVLKRLNNRNIFSS